MSKLIIHIGVGKTGTTSLQNNLFINLPGYKCLGRPNHQRYEYRNFFKGIMTAESYELDHLAIPFCEIVNSYLESGVSVIISDECLLSYKQPFSHVFYTYFLSFGALVFLLFFVTFSEFLLYKKKTRKTHKNLF